MNAMHRREQINQEQRANARIYGTPEHHYLTWTNTQAKIRRLCMRANADENGGPKACISECLFPYHHRAPEQGTKKLNIVCYAFEVYRKLPFPC